MCRDNFGGLLVEILLLFGAGLLGGALNSLAGGGSFIVFPALLLAGVPPIVANASNTYAALPGYVSGAIGYWRDVLKYKERLLIYSGVALIGGYLGAELLLRVSDAQFSIVIPWLIAIAVALFAAGNNISEWIAARSSGQKKLAIFGSIGLLVLLGVVCLYGGFFNAGLGIILLAFFALAGIKDIHAMNGLKLWISALVALVAVVRFAFDGSIAWFEGTVAFVGTLIGGYVAARFAHAIPARTIRIGIIIYGVVLTAVFFWQAYA